MAGLLGHFDQSTLYFGRVMGFLPNANTPYRRSAGKATSSLASGAGFQEQLVWSVRAINAMLGSKRA